MYFEGRFLGFHLKNEPSLTLQLLLTLDHSLLHRKFGYRY